MLMFMQREHKNKLRERAVREAGARTEMSLSRITSHESEWLFMN